jgi:hypothetical protein
VQSAKCACSGDKPCKHDGVADNTCFKKHELFGESVCPAGTTECLPEQVDTKLFRKDLTNAEVELKDKQCRNGVVVNGEVIPTAETNYCSDETPCKHQGVGDGHCMPMSTFQPLQEQLPVATSELKCRGTADWRRAEPSKVTGWFFGTDASCDMTGTSLGCTEAGHSYAMDKWCDHNCNPKVKGQPAFCPDSHCTCKAEIPAAKQEEGGWICPLDRYGDGTCRCAAGTERCGSIEVKAYKGTFSFEHLTIGKPGKYQLLVEVIMPDQNTGSNNIQISQLTSVFEVRYPSVNNGECRAQQQWRISDLPNSEVQGAGQSWFYEDTSIRCTSKNADGTCKETKQVYAMDKWCKANRCQEHTLINHCEVVVAPTLLRKAQSCTVTDAFGECCQSGVVDQCNVCDGDGSTCKIETYLSTFVADSATSDNIFDAKHAGHDCPSHSPCAHLNDDSCVPKTYNSAKLVDEEFEYCYKNMIGDNSHWKKGEWDDANGKLSIESGLHAAGNTDCFCPRGTVDVTDRAIIAEDAEKEFIDGYKKKIADVKQQVADMVVDAKMEVEMAAKDIMMANTEGGVELWSTPCDKARNGVGLKTALQGGKFRPTTGLAMENGKAKKATDKVGCIRVPPLVTVKTWKHGCKAHKDQKQYKNLVNTKVTVEFEDITEQSFGAIETIGNVLKPKVQIVGTESEAAEMACSSSVESRRCSGDSLCRKSMTAVKQCTKDGSNTVSCMSKNAYSGVTDLTKAWAGLALCMGKKLRSKNLFSIFSKGLFGGKRRLASGVTAAVRITTGGNNGLIGTPSSSASAQVPPAATATGKFATSSGTSGAAGGAGMGAGMTALVALVSVGAVVGAAVGLKKRQSGADMTAFTPGASKELTNKGAAKEDMTDVL